MLSDRQWVMFMQSVMSVTCFVKATECICSTEKPAIPIRGRLLHSCIRQPRCEEHTPQGACGTRGILRALSQVGHLGHIYSHANSHSSRMTDVAAIQPFQRGTKALSRSTKAKSELCLNRSHLPGAPCLSSPLH